MQFVLLHVHYNMEIDIDKVICQFAMLHPRKMEMVNTLLTNSENTQKWHIRESKSKEAHSCCRKTATIFSQIHTC